MAKRNINKALVWTIALLLLIGAAVAYLFSPKSPFQWLHEIIVPPKTTLSFIPGVFDQVLILDVDNELREVAAASNDLEEQDSFTKLLGTLREVVVYQSTTPDAIHNVLIFEWEEGFSIERVVEMGLLANDASYEYEKLTDNIWVYGDSASIRYVKNLWEQARAMDSEAFQRFNAARRAGGYNVWFFSRPNPQGETNPIALQFADRLQYTSLLSHINLESPSGRLLMQFDDGTIIQSSNSLNSTIIKRLNKQPWFFLEVSDILSVAGIDKDQINVYAPLLLAQVGASSDINAQDMQALADALEGNIAVLLTPSVLSPIQLGWHIIFDDEKAFNALSKLTPAFKWLIDLITWWAGLMDVEESISASEVIYSVTTGTGDAALSFPLITMTKQQGTTILSILTQTDVTLSESWVIDLPSFTNKTRMFFGWDAGLLQQNFLQAQIGQGETAQQLFQSGKIQGIVDLVPSEQQVQIEFFGVE